MEWIERYLIAAQGFVLIIALLFPSLIRLLWILIQVKRTEAYNTSLSGFKLGIFLHAIGCAISLGSMSYLMYQMSNCTGCVSGIFLLFLIPIVWPIVLFAELQLRRGKRS